MSEIRQARNWDMDYTNEHHISINVYIETRHINMANSIHLLKII